MTKQIERRTYSNIEFRVSAESEPAHISGYGAVFNSPSEDLGFFEKLTEEIDPNAFDKVMASSPDVRGLFNHDSNHVLGRTTAGTMRLSVDDRGLKYEIDPPDTMFAKDLMVSMRRKDISGSSFAFTVARDQWTDMPDGSVTRRILEIGELLDVSCVTYPAYPASSSQVSMATCPVELRSRLSETREMVEGNDNGCDCSCSECVSGACMDCTNAECDDPECLLNQASRSLNEDANRRLAIRVGFSTL
jgi:HK97 family phage prohead protease